MKRLLPLLVAVALSVPIPAHAAAGCRVQIVGVADYTALQPAIDAAADGAHITVRGECVGNVRIEKNLTLSGRPTQAYAMSTIRGDGTGTVLYVGFVRVKIHSLLITGGNGSDGGGILDYGDLRLSGVTTVSGNSATNGGGIAVGGKLLLRDRAVVRDNTASGYGGGIWLIAGHVKACANWTGAISPNTPDDPPTVAAAPC